jgi:beta-phosphoglucomutase-like phosphatase (HAD superfamily)
VNPLAFNGVLFDLDGTLIDTMPLHYEAYRRTFLEMNLSLTPEAFYGNVGGTGLETIPRFLAGRAAPCSVAEIHDRKKRQLALLLDEVELTVLPAGLLLPLLRGRVPMAVATSGARPGVERMLSRVGWLEMFQAVVTAEDVRNGKPAPEVYLEAARLIGVPAGECLAFEDTDDGVASARAAGAAVVDVRSMTTFPTSTGRG